MTYRFAFIIMSALVASCSTTSDQAPPAEPQVHGATIEGYVREAGTNRGIAGANVFVVRPPNQPQIQTTSDGDGHFLLSGLDTGRYLVGYSKDGYVIPERLENSGSTFRIDSDRRITDVVLTLISAGSVFGRVLKTDGEPARKVEVQLLQNLYVMGHLQWTAVTPASARSKTETNEHGEFRILGVDPGEYLVRLNPREATIENIVPGGKPPGPILYPGVRDISAARPITVQSAQETRLDDVTLPVDKRGWIRVAVINKSGESLEGFGSWSLEPPGWMGSGYPRYQERVVNNAHEFQPDLPGTYEISALWTTPKGPLVGRLHVVYTGSTSELKMTLEKGKGKLTGKLVLEEEGQQPRPLPGAEVSIGPDIPYFAHTRADGSFEISEVYAGKYKLGYVSGMSPDAYIASAMQGSRDVLRDDLLMADTPTNLDVVIGLRGGLISGRVLDAESRPAHNALVALIPDSPLRERSDYYGVYQSVHADQEGRFELRGITPGSYKVYAWMNVPSAAFRNEQFMKQFAGRGKAVTIEAGGKRSIDLSVLSAPGR